MFSCYGFVIVRYFKPDNPRFANRTVRIKRAGFVDAILRSGQTRRFVVARPGISQFLAVAFDESKCAVYAPPIEERVITEYKADQNRKHDKRSTAPMPCQQQWICWFQPLSEKNTERYYKPLINWLKKPEK